eukprot:2600125-Rhodomonas_salina.2
MGRQVERAEMCRRGGRIKARTTKGLGFRQVGERYQKDLPGCREIGRGAKAHSLVAAELISEYERVGLYATPVPDIARSIRNANTAHRVHCEIQYKEPSAWYKLY